MCIYIFLTLSSRIQRLNLDITKVANAIIYMLEKDIKQLNDKKLSALMFLIDYESLQKNGKKIFDDEYIKESRNPEPKLLTEIFEILANDEDLEDDDFRLDLIQELLSFVEIQIQEKQNFIELKFSKYEEEFDKSIFNKDELDIIKTIAHKYKDASPRNTANDCFKIEKLRETQKGEVII